MLNGPFQVLRDRFPVHQRRLFTVLFLIDQRSNDGHNDGQMLLGMKKRGFGAGLWNGFGGKVDIGKDMSVASAAMRELREESGVALCEEPRLRGVMYFEFDSADKDKLFEVHVFDAKWQQRYATQLQETEEMRPQWFDMDSLPFEHMWQDDVFWFPHLLAPWQQQEEAKVSDKGTPMNFFRGYFRFSRGYTTIEEQAVQPVENLEQLLADCTFEQQAAEHK